MKLFPDDRVQALFFFIELNSSFFFYSVTLTFEPTVFLLPDIDQWISYDFLSRKMNLLNNRIFIRHLMG